MNCSDLLETRYLPTAREAFSALGNLGTVPLVVGGISILFIFVLFIQETLILSRTLPLKPYLLTWGCLSVFPIVGICLFLTILVPRVAEYTSSIILLFLPVPMVFFYELVVSYAGGEEPLLVQLQGEEMPLQGPPLCFLCCCCPKPLLNRRKYMIIKLSIYQLAVVNLLVFVMAKVTDYFNRYNMGELNITSAAPYLLLVNALCFFIGVYGIVIFTRMCSPHFPGSSLRAKFIILQTNFILIRCHFFIFDFFGRAGMLPCQPPFSSHAAGQYIRSALLLSECFILAVLGRIFFTRSPPLDPEHDEQAIKT